MVCVVKRPVHAQRHYDLGEGLHQTNMTDAQRYLAGAELILVNIEGENKRVHSPTMIDCTVQYLVHQSNGENGQARYATALCPNSLNSHVKVFCR